jgi:hypothetical protein
MALLPSSGTLSVTTINTLKSLGSTYTSLTSRELQYMGGNPASASTSLVCFPNQNEKVSATNWTYNGSSLPWRPTTISEFYGAYNNLPAVAVTTTGTGTRSTANFIATCSNSSIYVNAATPYSVYGVNVTGVTHPNLGSWIVCSAVNGTQFTWAAASVSSGGTSTLRVYVRDFRNCGTMNEFTGTVNYP